MSTNLPKHEPHNSVLPSNKVNNDPIPLNNNNKIGSDPTPLKKLSSSSRVDQAMLHGTPPTQNFSKQNLKPLLWLKLSSRANRYRHSTVAMNAYQKMRSFINSNVSRRISCSTVSLRNSTERDWLIKTSPTSRRWSKLKVPQWLDY